MSIKLFNTLCAVIKVARQLRGKMKWKKCLSPIIDLPAVYRLVTSHFWFAAFYRANPPYLCLRLTVGDKQYFASSVTTGLLPVFRRVQFPCRWRTDSLLDF